MVLRLKKVVIIFCTQVLVLIRHNLPSLMNCLKTALGFSSLLEPETLTSGDSEAIIARLV